MNLQDLRTLLDYHYWARDRMFDALDPLTAEQVNRDMGNSFKTIRDTVTHLYAAEWAWYSRWQGTSPTKLLTTDTYPDLAALRRAWEKMRRTCAPSSHARTRWVCAGDRRNLSAHRRRRVDTR